MNDDEAAFQKALDDDPRDFTTMLVFADWLQDRDDPRAGGYRAMGMLERVVWFYSGANIWGWFSERWDATNHPQVRPSVLPNVWYDKIPKKSTDSSWSRLMDCDTKLEAREAAATAWAELTEEARDEILKVVGVTQ